MTEAEWLACTDPTRMLEFLRKQRTTSGRKSRLFAAACCRRVWDWLGERSRRAVEVMERYVDGAATFDELVPAMRGAEQDWIEEWGTHHPSNAASIAVAFRDRSPHDVASGAAAEIVAAVGCEASASVAECVAQLGRLVPREEDLALRRACARARDETMAAERVAQCQLLRDIFHGPCRAVHFRPRWRTGTVRSIASAIYGDRNFEQFPILADALEDAGCDDSELLGHLRGPELHFRGCRALDAILGKS